MDRSDMDRKERILEYIRSERYIPLKRSELRAVLGVPEEDKPEFKKLLNELVVEGLVVPNKKGRYIATKDSGISETGILQTKANKYFGFVITDNPDSADIYVPGEKLGAAIDGDRVTVVIDNMLGASPEGHIVSVLERNRKFVVGVTLIKKGQLVLNPDGGCIYSRVKIDTDRGLEARPGDRVRAELTETDEEGFLHGKITEILGAADSIDSCVSGILLENGIKTEFEPETQTEAQKAPKKIYKKDIKKRLDLRDELIITIDGKDSRDFDDAVSIAVLDNGNYLLGVHIADVSHYVRAGSALDDEAFKRATSVYLADRVIPMLPERLSNGICSLNPDEDRLTMSVIMEINQSGEIENHEIRESVIRSKYRMTYEDTNAIFDGDEELNERYGELVPTLKQMAELAAILKRKREERGAISFDIPETKIVVDSKGQPIDIHYAERGVSNKMIEEFMLAANETVAELAYRAELPFVYRVHMAPDTGKITEFNEFLKHFGFMLRGGFDKDNPIHPKALQQIMDKVKDTPEERVVADNLLRSLMKADYRPENLGHFGLAAKYYCHFTSPIRRYPDLAIHRILKAYMHSEDISGFSDFTKAVSKRSSSAEISALTVERAVDDLMMAAYMTSDVGKTYDGIISGITSFGMFVALDNSVEGLVKLNSMRDDYFIFDETARELRGRRTGKLYKIGDRVRVIVTRANMPQRQIDFVLEDNISEKTAKRLKLPIAEELRAKRLAEGKPSKKKKKRKRRKRKKKKNGQ